MPSQGGQDQALRTLQEENHRLHRAVEELSILNDLARAIGASLDTQEIIQTIVRRSLRAVGAEQGVVTLVEEHSEHSMKTLVRTMVSSSEHGQFHFHQALLGWMHINMKPLVVNDPQHDARFHGVDWDESIRSLVAVPLMIKSELRGVLAVYNKRDGKPFSDDDQRLLSIIAAQSAQVIDNARLYEKERALLKMQEEVRLAARIQLELLPKVPPSVAGYSLAGATIPAQEVGGDYYDFISVDDHRLAICLGDVTGKGLPASLLMANLQATLRGQSLVVDSPKTCLGRANRLLFQSTSPEKFATLFYAILDTKEHRLCYTNAGQDRPFLLSTSPEFRRLKTGGIPLGMIDEFTFEEESIALSAGDAIVIYSDGVSEAMNADGEMFGEQRIADVISSHRAASPTEFVDHIVAAVRQFVQHHPQSDDITIVAIRRNSD